MGPHLVRIDTWKQSRPGQYLRVAFTSFCSTDSKSELISTTIEHRDLKCLKTDKPESWPGWIMKITDLQCSLFGFTFPVHSNASKSVAMFMKIVSFDNYGWRFRSLYSILITLFTAFSYRTVNFSELSPLFSPDRKNVPRFHSYFGVYFKNVILILHRKCQLHLFY